MTQELKRKAERRETCTITINSLELLEMVVTAWVILDLTGDMPELVGDPIVMHVANVVAVTWVNHGGEARNKRA